MGIPGGASYELGANCPAGVGPPHSYWDNNATPLYVYVTFTGIELCPTAPGYLPQPPNGVTIRLTETDPCSWTWNDGSWYAAWSLGFFNIVTLNYLDGLNEWKYFQGNNPDGKTIAPNIYTCGPALVAARSGVSELVWSGVPTQILYEYNLCSVDGTRFADIPVDANTSQYRFANKEIGMNVWVEYDHS